MASGEESPYRVEPTGPAKAQIRKLVAKAVAAGEHQAVLDALRVIAQQLKTRPLEWGDPERRTRRKGGLVCHGIYSAIFVQYAVFKAEKVVLLLKVSEAK